MKFLYFPINELPIKPMFWYMTQKNMTTNKPYCGTWIVWGEDGYYRIVDFGDLTTA